MNDFTRRIFLVRSIAGGCAIASLARSARAAAHVEETDDTATALGYHHDTRLTDQKKYPSHTPDQHCSECQFWQATPADAWGGCAMFGRKQVAAGGWCGAFSRKP